MISGIEIRVTLGALFVSLADVRSITTHFLLNAVFAVAFLTIEAKETGLLAPAALVAAILATSSVLAGQLHNLNDWTLFSKTRRDEWDAV